MKEGDGQRLAEQKTFLRFITQRCEDMESEWVTRVHVTAESVGKERKEKRKVLKPCETERTKHVTFKEWP